MGAAITLCGSLAAQGDCKDFARTRFLQWGGDLTFSSCAVMEWLQHLAIVIAVVGGWFLKRGQMGEREEGKNEPQFCEECASGTRKCHTYAGLPPWGFWLTLVTLALTGASSYGRLNLEVTELKLWRDEAQSNRFTKLDWEREHVLVLKELEGERAYSRALCNEVTRISKELGVLPANDCARP